MGRFRKQNKCNFPSKYWTATVEAWNTMSEEFISKACKSFRRQVDKIIEKNGEHIE